MSIEHKWLLANMWGAVMLLTHTDYVMFIAMALMFLNLTFFAKDFASVVGDKRDSQ